jgi:ubiquinone/menaquinone biosynthesis C-methylase UbiE
MKGSGMEASVETVGDYYNRIAADYDHSRFANRYGAWLHAQETAFLERHLPKEGAILSLGCGTGRLLPPARIMENLLLRVFPPLRRYASYASYIIFAGAR